VICQLRRVPVSRLLATDEKVQGRTVRLEGFLVATCSYLRALASIQDCYALVQLLRRRIHARGAL